MRRIILSVMVVLLVSAQNDQKCCGVSTVTTSGNGKVSATPDTATFSVTAESTNATSKAASSTVNQMVNQVLRILAQNNVRQSDIKTTQLTISPQYDWNNGTQKLRGQQASQTISVKLRNIPSDGTSIGKIVDALVTLNGISVSGVNFDI